jgi:hypothetical protein
MRAQLPRLPPPCGRPRRSPRRQSPTSRSNTRLGIFGILDLARRRVPGSSDGPADESRAMRASALIGKGGPFEEALGCAAIARRVAAKVIPRVVVVELEPQQLERRTGKLSRVSRRRIEPPPQVRQQPRRTRVSRACERSDCGGMRGRGAGREGRGGRAGCALWLPCVRVVKRRFARAICRLPRPPPVRLHRPTWRHGDTHIFFQTAIPSPFPPHHSSGPCGHSSACSACTSAMLGAALDSARRRSASAAWRSCAAAASRSVGGASGWSNPSQMSAAGAGG